MSKDNKIKKIVILDDEEIIVNLLKDSLEEEGFQIFATTIEEEAITLVREQNPSIVLLDMRMPNMTGIEVLRELRSFNKEAKVFFISAYGVDEFAQEAQRLGVEDFIPKGTSINVLKNKIIKSCE